MTDTTAAFRSALPPLATLQETPKPPSFDRTASDFEQQARNQAEEFEASFLASLLQPVFEGLARDSIFGGGFAEETWTGLLTQEYAKSIASSSDLGISDHVYRQIVDLQEQADGKTTATSEQLSTLYSTAGDL